MAEQSAASAPSASRDGRTPRLTVSARLKAYFFAGILITAPITITFYLAWQFISFVDRQVTPLVPQAYQAWSIPGFGLVLVVSVLTLVGALTAGFVGRTWLKLSEAIVTHMPVLSGVYSAIKQIFETVLAQKSQAFREVALIEYPRPGLWTLAFITGSSLPVINEATGEEMVNVFVPTTPNPTSGFLLFLPRRDVRILPIAVDDGLKLVISSGIVVPPDLLPPPAETEAVSGAESSDTVMLDPDALKH